MLNKKRFDALKSRVDQLGSPNVGTGILQIFSINVCALLDPGATLYFVSPLVDMKFDMLSDVIVEPFWVTPVGYSVVKEFIGVVSYY